MASDSLDEKRVYGERTGATELYVASDLGVTLVSVSEDIVGEFTLAHRCRARDVAAGPNLAVATDEDVLVSDDGAFAGTEFGPAVAVGFHDGRLLAAGPDGRVARRDDGTWVTLGTAGEVRAVDGPLVASADGVRRVDGDGLVPGGLSDVRDVAATGTPLAATGDGLYYLGPGWAQAVTGAFEAVASDGERAGAATAETLYRREGDDWRDLAVPAAEPLVDVAHGEGVYAVTVDGTLFTEAGDGWRSRALGLAAVAGLAVATPEREPGRRSGSGP